jgi:hypothetical protein
MATLNALFRAKFFPAAKVVVEHKPMVCVKKDGTPTIMEFEVATLQARQRRILGLKWANFRRFNPSRRLAANLNEMYDSTVVQLVHKCGEEAHVSQVDAEQWDLYCSSYSNWLSSDPESFLENHVTLEEAVQVVRLGLSV